MEEYLQYMKTLRTQMNDVEDQAAKISVEEQMQITTIHTLEKDLNLAKSETKRLMEESDQMIKCKAEICSKILEKQKRIASLESDSFNLSQSLEFIQKEHHNLSNLLQAKRTAYPQVFEQMNSKLQEQKDWVKNKQHDETPGGSNMETDSIQEDSSNGAVPCNLENEDKSLLLRKFDAAQSKRDEFISAKTKLVSQNSELKQSLEQIKNEINNLKPELSTTEVITLEEELKALLLEKDGELEYMQSLRCQLEKLKGISHVIKCACGGEYKVEMGHCT